MSFLFNKLKYLPKRNMKENISLNNVSQTYLFGCTTKPAAMESISQLTLSTYAFTAHPYKNLNDCI